MPPPTLHVLNPTALAQAAGGDPWLLQDQLLEGNPALINQWGDAFRRTGTDVGRNGTVLGQVLTLYGSAYVSSYGGSPEAGTIGSRPIAESDAIRSAGSALHLTSINLPLIGDGLKEIATRLTAAQNNTHGPIDALNSQLIALDSEFLELSRKNIRAIQGDVLSHEWLRIERSKVEAVAVTAIRAVYGQLEPVYDDYDNLLSTQAHTVEGISRDLGPRFR
ncbi:hypothetical protein ACFZC5_08950 [Nocardia gamkensis]|uniref:putative alpha/beta hydrolase n=1 Tax=Nocardia gamkensis TaxID=352869 RepID=UPI0036E6C114